METVQLAFSSDPKSDDFAPWQARLAHYLGRPDYWAENGYTRVYEVIEGKYYRTDDGGKTWKQDGIPRWLR